MVKTLKEFGLGISAGLVVLVTILLLTGCASGPHSKAALVEITNTNNASEGSVITSTNNQSVSVAPSFPITAGGVF